MTHEPTEPAASAEHFGHTFADRDLLTRALTHPSWASEHGGTDYQRLEFLGDSVLGLLIAERVHELFPSRPEGDLTAMKASVVRGRTLAEAARSMGVPGAVRLGRGADSSGDRERPSVLEAVFEALVGAVYLDAGLDAARTFVDRALAAHLDRDVLLGAVSDPKSGLQELTQARGMGLPEYRVESVRGPAHDRTFTVEVSVGGAPVAKAAGRSKQAAEQAAASQALRALEDIG